MEENRVTLNNGKLCVYWLAEKPNVNQWYRCISSCEDFIKITKDYYSVKEVRCFYKIVQYYNGYVIEHGLTLKQAREYIRENTFRMVF